MNETENFIIKTLKDSQNTYIEDTKVTKVLLTTQQAKILLNLIERQQKEIEDLKDVQQQICNEELLTQEYVQNNYIRKDKIREFINKYSKIAVTEDKNVYSIIEEKDIKKELLGE